ncbi:uncharacterized protein CGFF_05047 [Nakaseomyces glabratus]|nr:hypothetical protein J6894_02770 [Nakaseomyces glabratus]QNG14847.1 uncharacterized protein GWK60_I05687 [Nakaseomyces glabratus]SCV17485.1 uncharacterized protein CGFF_05047 [Nakaseomyces glabratus]SLM17269.1 uncharacterized protein CGFF_05047 [Nakaseomyces glabratus]
MSYWDTLQSILRQVTESRNCLGNHFISFKQHLQPIDSNMINLWPGTAKAQQFLQIMYTSFSITKFDTAS